MKIWTRWAAATAAAITVLGGVPRTAGADAESAQARWGALQAADACALAPKRCQETERAMTALAAAPTSETALADAEKKLQAFEAAVARARSVWPDIVELREAARTSGAPRRDPKGWTKAENVFRAAAQKLEAGRVDAARSQARESIPLYEATHMVAMRADVIGPADSIRVALEAGKARTWVPRSSVRTVDAIEAARRQLADRGTIDTEVRAAGDRAFAEAKHAQFLLDRFRNACDGSAPDRLEASVLEWEESTRRILQAAGLEASFDSGLGPPLDKIADEAQRLRSERDRLRVDTTRRAGDADTLRQSVQGLQAELHDRELQITELRRQIGEYRTVEKVQALFGRDEGRVLVEDRDLVLRLHGLQFAAGSAEIPATGQGILEDVRQAIQAVPGARIVVEGHTDSQGKPDKNRELSQQRAVAVRDWIASRTGLDARSITATGYGATRPVASNDTEEGRALNRRIEIVLARPQ